MARPLFHLRGKEADPGPTPNPKLAKLDDGQLFLLLEAQLMEAQRHASAYHRTMDRTEREGALTWLDASLEESSLASAELRRRLA